MKKTFYYKVEDLPLIGEFILNSLRRDINDFNKFSPIFTPNYLKTIEMKINTCKDFISSFEMARELKTVTQQIHYKANILCMKLNVLEDYFKTASNDLDIFPSNMIFKITKNNIAKHNTDVLLLNMQIIMATIKRNQSVLTVKGLKPKIIKEVENQFHEISKLYALKNDMLNDYNRLMNKSIGMFNDLWENLQPVFKTARTAYQNVDETKLQDYTATQLMKRINTKNKEYVIDL
jgi:hypothetical protein